MKTKCETCIYRFNFDHDCKQHKQTTDEWKGLLIVLSCTGHQESTTPTPIDQTAQPDTVTA